MPSEDGRKNVKIEISREEIDFIVAGLSRMEEYNIHMKAKAGAIIESIINGLTEAKTPNHLKARQMDPRQPVRTPPQEEEPYNPESQGYEE